MDWSAPILKGLLLGLGAAAPIGPVNVEIARRTLRGGFWRGFALGCGAVTVDVLYAVVTGLSLQRFFDRPAVVVPLTVAGILLLLYLAFLSLRAALRDLRADPLDPLDPLDPVVAAATPSPSPRSSAHGAYLTGVLMTLLNPMTLAFWFTVVPTMAGSTAGAANAAANTEAGRFDLPMICAGVFIGTVGWVVFFAGALNLAGRGGTSPAAGRRRRWLAAGADLAGGVTLLGFCLAAVWRLWRSGGVFL